MPRQPTAASELRRGLDAYNLLVGALSSLALGLLILIGGSSGFVPDVVGRGVLAQSVVAALVLFVIITGMHTVVHTYFGWRFDRGIRAAADDDHARALRLLGPVERPGMGHYDPEGRARAALAACRAALQLPSGGPPAEVR
jgi:hypothetical protein